MQTIIKVKGKQEARRLLEKKRPIHIKFPNLKIKEIRNFWILTLGIIAIAFLIFASTWHVAFKQGQTESYTIGYKEGYKHAVEQITTTKSLTLQEALSWNLRLNLNKYLAWFGFVVGLSWIFHGTGFHFIKTR